MTLIYFNKKTLFNFFIYYIVTLLLLEFYSDFAIGYFKAYTLYQNSIIEYITIFIIYSIFFLFLKNKNLYYIPFVFLSGYTLIDFVSSAYNRYPDYSDLSNIPLLYDALLQSKGDILYLIFLPLLILIYLLFKFNTTRAYIYALVVVSFIFIEPFISHNFLADLYTKLYEKSAYCNSYFWTPNKLEIDYAKTGRLSTFFYSGMKKQQQYQNILKYHTNQKKELEKIVTKLKNYNIEKRNIYLIGLESFSLPNQLTKLKLKYLNNDKDKTYDVVNNASTMITSIFGGGTIQSEFEALCGVPALQKISAFEFTEFIGFPTNCLPQILNKLGFSTIVSNTYKPQPSFIALKSIGFHDINFPKEYFPNRNFYITNKNKTKGEYAIFDTDFFNQNKQYIQTHYLDKNKTIFNYMFSVWGHAFHNMNSPKRPIAIKILNKDKYRLSEHTILQINQAYYRIRALQKYFDNIKKSDPTALVIAFSDHRPVMDGVDSYREYGLKEDVFHNFIVIMDRGKYIKYPKPFPLYALPDIILDRLTNGKYCKENSCKINTLFRDREKYLKEYYSIMANAIIENKIDLREKEEHFFLIPSKRYSFYDTTIPFIHFSHIESNFRWSNAKVSSIAFQIKDKQSFSGKFTLNIGTLGEQKIGIYLNNHLLYKKILNGSNITLNIPFNINILKENKINYLTFKLPNAHKPENGDRRILAMQFKSIIFNRKQ